MKKLFFSAVALVAFSSVSMANTIEIEVKKTTCSDNSKKDIVDPDCHWYSFQVYNSARENGYSVSDANILANRMYFRCMGEAIPKSLFN